MTPPMTRRVRLVLCCLAAGLGPASAEPAGTPPGNAPSQGAAEAAKERLTLEAYGKDHLACLEWSDGCAVCLRQKGQDFACSLPGIACEPGPPSCRQEAKGDGKSDTQSAPAPVEPGK